jgi:hypothetical protein
LIFAITPSLPPFSLAITIITPIDPDARSAQCRRADAAIFIAAIALLRHAVIDARFAEKRCRGRVRKKR